MSEKTAWRNWAIVFGLLIVFAIATAVWSSLTPNLSFIRFGGGVDIPRTPPPELEPIDLSFLGIDMALSPFLAVAALAGIFIALTVGAGLAIGAVNLLLSRQVENVAGGDDDFDPERSRLRPLYNLLNRGIEFVEKRKEGQFDGRVTGSKPEEHPLPGWAVATTALTILMFTAFLGMIIGAEFFPETMVLNNGAIINPTTIVVLVMLLIVGVVLAIRLRPQTVLSTESDDKPIPWDSIAVLITGLLVVGLSLGAMLYLLNLG